MAAHALGSEDTTGSLHSHYQADASVPSMRATVGELARHAGDNGVTKE